MVKATVTSGKKVGLYVGPVALRASVNFNIQILGQKPLQGISHRFCQLIQQSDGYSYCTQPTFLEPIHRGAPIHPSDKAQGILGEIR